ncbi:MAG: hypothetical protein GF398_11565 [Chitinivibrionales bacterium]|nr:hypothetical protein [Chitinivibrionales bacterium]
MHWDDIPVDTSAGPGYTVTEAQSYWHIVPALNLRAGSEEELTGENYGLHGDLISDIRLKKLLVRLTLDIDTKYMDDPIYLWKKDRFAAGRIEEAYLHYNWKYGLFRFGRLKRNWGPYIDRSLLLSSNPHTYDAFEWSMHRSYFEFRHLFAYLNHAAGGMYENIDGNAAYNKYFAAHALNFVIQDWATLGIMESILLTRTGFPDFQYVNPFSIYTVTNTNKEGSGNLMWGFHYKVHPFVKQITLLGQIIIDDFQADNEIIADKEPTHWGGDWSASWKNFLPLSLQHALSLNYRYKSKWLYTVHRSGARTGERYLYLGKSLGQPEIDGDYAEITATVLGNNYWMADAGLSFRRSDTNTIYTDWPAADSLNPVGTIGYRKETPLYERENVEKTIDLFVNLRGYFKGYVDIHLSLHNQWIQNENNAATSGWEYNPIVGMMLSLHYSNLILKLPE